MFRKVWMLMVFVLVFAGLGYASQCIDYSDWVPGTYGGGFQLDCTICEDTMHCTADYRDFSGYPGVVANGEVEIDVDFYYGLFGSTLDITIYGGPVIYTVEGEDYEVYYKDLYFEIVSNGYYTYIADVGGGLTVDGIYFSGDEVFFSLLF